MMKRLISNTATSSLSFAYYFSKYSRNDLAFRPPLDCVPVGSDWYSTSTGDESIPSGPGTNPRSLCCIMLGIDGTHDKDIRKVSAKKGDE